MAADLNLTRRTTLEAWAKAPWQAFTSGQALIADTRAGLRFKVAF